MVLMHIWRGVSARRLEHWADEVAHRSRSQVWDRIQHSAPTMRLAEVRGYIRARARRVVEAETDRWLQSQPGIDASIRGAVISTATDRVVTLVIRDLVKLPTRFTFGRRAA